MIHVITLWPYVRLLINDKHDKSEQYAIYLRTDVMITQDALKRKIFKLVILHD